MVPRIYNFLLKTLILHDMDAGKQQSLNLVNLRPNSGIYTTSSYFEGQKSFRMTVSSYMWNTLEILYLGNVLMFLQVSNPALRHFVITNHSGC